MAWQTLDILIAAHVVGVIHRDIKPDNLFLTREGALKVLDFGIAQLMHSGTPGSPALTRAGLVLGTPAFLPPEQALGRTQEIDARTDIWAVGATMFWLLSERYVHEAATVEELLVFSGSQAARPLRSVAPQTPAALAAVIDRALAFDKNDRWSSALEMQVALEEACPQSSAQRIVASQSNNEARSKPPNRPDPRAAIAIALVMFAACAIIISFIPMSCGSSSTGSASAATVHYQLPERKVDNAAPSAPLPVFDQTAAVDRTTTKAHQPPPFVAAANVTAPPALASAKVPPPAVVLLRPGALPRPFASPLTLSTRSAGVSLNRSVFNEPDSNSAECHIHARIPSVRTACLGSLGKGRVLEGIRQCADTKNVTRAPVGAGHVVGLHACVCTLHARADGARLLRLVDRRERAHSHRHLFCQHAVGYGRPPGTSLRRWSRSETALRRTHRGRPGAAHFYFYQRARNRRKDGHRVGRNQRTAHRRRLERLTRQCARASSEAINQERFTSRRGKQ